MVLGTMDTAPRGRNRIGVVDYDWGGCLNVEAWLCELCGCDGGTQAWSLNDFFLSRMKNLLLIFEKMVNEESDQ